MALHMNITIIIIMMLGAGGASGTTGAGGACGSTGAGASASRTTGAVGQSVYLGLLVLWSLWDIRCWKCWVQLVHLEIPWCCGTAVAVEDAVGHLELLVL